MLIGDVKVERDLYQNDDRQGTFANTTPFFAFFASRKQTLVGFSTPLGAADALLHEK